MFRLVTTASSSYQAHYNAPRIWSELHNPTLSRFNAIVHSSFLFAVVINCLVLSFGFLTFGSNSSGLILNNYSNFDTLAVIARISICLGTIFGFPLSFTALRDGVSDFIGTSDKHNIFTTVTLLIVIMSSSLVLKNVSTVISFSGAIFGTSLIYILPSYMSIAVLKKELHRCNTTPMHATVSSPKSNESSKLITARRIKSEIVIQGFIGVFGVIIAVVGVILSVQKLV